MLTKELKEIIKEDIKLCEKQQETKIGSEKLLEALIAKYSTIYDGFKDEIPINGKCAAVGSEFDYRQELNSLKTKLEMILATGILKKNSVPSISISNSNTNQITVNITFLDVREQIRNMESLSEIDTENTLKKIDEIEKIVKSTDSKKTKWQKLKPILAWIADKSVDVGIALLPLLLKIGG